MTELICASRGPRIGDEGTPFCKRELGHDGTHHPHPEDGWGKIGWGAPSLADLHVRQEFQEAHIAPFSLA